MVTFFETPGCSGCETIREVLKELCIAHEVVAAPGDVQRSDHLPEQAEAPMLVDGDEIVRGHKNIVQHLDKLKKFSALWYKFQSDVCYCDEDDPIA